jgi:hypothetical protein
MMSPALIEQFKNEVCGDFGIKLDDEILEIDWYSLSIGWFLAKGASVQDAADLAREARYKHQYWYQHWYNQP